VWYAGLGAAATACDVAADTFDRFVDRGQRVQDDLQQRVDGVRARNAGTRGRVGDTFRSAMNFFLDSINVPNKADVDTINAKLNIVTRKLDDLQYEQVRAATPPPPPVAPDEPVPPDEAEGMIGI
jgi:polyhydroxyalkanoate synthesis regulator phasin